MNAPGPADEARLWSLQIAQAPPSLDLLAILSPDEVQRAERFAFAQDARRFVVARAALRAILAQATQREPSKVSLATSSRGKPYLVAPCRRLHFSSSHAGETVLIGLSTRRIGVDVEKDQSIPNLAALANTVCGPAERMAIGRLQGDDQKAAFYDIWTRKEALLKGVGCGLLVEPRRIDVGRANTAGSTDSIGRWRLTSWREGDTYFAVALRAQSIKVKLRESLTWNFILNR